ncbi:hypothetical protein [Parashewanella tropica]|uniref:hypothetical protein n=1 Tax=Parashewanella tropica TaxID=2547970 RepID=UPI00105935D0|nr:hypothetical protein [Parashewanella tropica]
MEELKNSGIGIASFIISIASGIFIFLLIAIAGYLEASTPGGVNEESSEAIIVGLFLFAFLGTALVALGLGIAGLFQKERKKIFAILGTVFSTVTLAITFLIMMIGLAEG